MRNALPQSRYSFSGSKYLGGLRRETLIPLLLDRKTEKTIGNVLEKLLQLNIAMRKGNG